MTQEETESYEQTNHKYTNCDLKDPKQKSRGWDEKLQVNSIKHLRVNTYPSEMFQETARENIPSPHSARPPCLISRADKNDTQKGNIGHADEHRCKNPQYDTSNPVQQYIKKDPHNDQVRFGPGVQGWGWFVKQCDNTTSTNWKRSDISQINTRCRKGFDKVNTHLWSKALRKWAQGTYLKIIKAIYDKPIANVILNGGEAQVNENTKGYRLYCTQHSFEVLSLTIKRGK